MSRTAPVIVGSERSEAGLPDGMKVLLAGGSAIDAVETAMRRCEDNLDDHYVGTGGLPNALGEVQLDASLMLGSDRRFGAVAALQGFPNPISVARAVLERLPQHCMLAGEGAARFALECGFEPAKLLTPEAMRLWRESLADTDDSVEGGPSLAYPGDRAYRAVALDLVRRLAPHDGPWGTTNILAIDDTGEMCVGVSTSGYPWKYPGRIGDSAIPGAGIYCDGRIGGAAATGRGELSMRGGAARTVVDNLAAGMAPEKACLAALADIATLPDEFRSQLRLLTLRADGSHASASFSPGTTYVVMTEHSVAPEFHTGGDLSTTMAGH
jgi:beta-aspartyl-peptidase (threonine type)